MNKNPTLLLSNTKIWLYGVILMSLWKILISCYFHTKKTLRKHFALKKLSNIWKSKLKLNKIIIKKSFTYLTFRASSAIYCFFFCACSKLFIYLTCLLKTVLHRNTPLLLLIYFTTFLTKFPNSFNLFCNCLFY